MKSLTSIQARQVIACLKRGVFPPVGIERLTAGRKGEIASVKQAFAGAADGTSGGLFFEADFGHGKSHMLRTVEALALENGFAVSWVAFDHKSHAFNHPTRYLHTLLEHLRVPGLSTRGLANIVEEWLRGSKRDEIVAYSNGAPWHLNYPLHHLSFGYASPEQSEYPRRVLESRDIQARSGIAYYPEVYSRMEWIGGLIRAAGLKGVVWLFDEVERIYGLHNCQSRYAAFSVLKRFLDVGRFPHSWFFFSTTTDFRLRLLTEKQPYMRYDGAAQFVQDWRAGKHTVHKLRKLTRSDNEELLCAIREVHALAYSWDPAARVDEAFNARFMDSVATAVLTERELIKSYVTILEICEQHPECDPDVIFRRSPANTRVSSPLNRPNCAVGLR